MRDRSPSTFGDVAVSPKLGSPVFGAKCRQREYARHAIAAVSRSPVVGNWILLAFGDIRDNREGIGRAITNFIGTPGYATPSGFAPRRSGAIREVRGDGGRPIAKFTDFTDFTLFTKFARSEFGKIRKIGNICKIRNGLPSASTRLTESAEFAPSAFSDDHDAGEVGRIRDGSPSMFAHSRTFHQMCAVEPVGTVGGSSRIRAYFMKYYNPHICGWRGFRLTPGIFRFPPTNSPPTNMRLTVLVFNGF